MTASPATRRQAMAGVAALVLKMTEDTSRSRLSVVSSGFIISVEAS